MSRAQELVLIAGCAILLVLELPQAVRTLIEDLEGPYARRGVAPVELVQRVELPSPVRIGPVQGDGESWRALESPWARPTLLVAGWSPGD